MSTLENARAAPVRRAGLFRWLTVATTLLVIVQAAMAGQFLFQGSPVMQWHGALGNLVFAAAVVLAGLALIEARADGRRRAEFVLSLVLVLLVFAQLGLGYSGRRTALAAALHIPNGVLLACVCSALIGLAFARSGAAREESNG